MRVLIFHGYLLHGTGSNVYNADLAQALKRMGHEVHLICQDADAAALDWVDAVGDWEGGSLRIERLRGGDGAGSVTVYRPEIGGLLPVFVADRYEGFEVKTFPELSEEELARYLDANIAAVHEVVESAGQPEAALANHLIMGPVILARVGLRYALKVHGSDLSYTVRPHPERFVPYAREATDAAAGILVGSAHSAADLFATVADPELPARTRLGPPGVDVHRFRPRPPDRGREGARSPRRSARRGGRGVQRWAIRRQLRPRRGRRCDRTPQLGAGIAEGAVRRQAAGQQGRRSARRRLAADRTAATRARGSSSSASALTGPASRP